MKILRYFAIVPLALLSLALMATSLFSIWALTCLMEAKNTLIDANSK